jgi:fructose-bisphosphate aldolase class II
MIVSFKEMLQAANNGRYAVGAFNCLSLENVEGAIAAAEELHSPIIIQLAEVQFPCAPLALMAPLYLEAARAAKVPVVVHLDHGQSFQTCVDAVRLGFGSVMFDGASLPFEENVRQTAEVARMAKAFGVDVEAELRKVGDVGVDDDKVDLFTDVEESAEFIARTGVDALAVAIGNQHGKYVATPRLNIARLVELHERNAMPLVLHGGSGTSEEDFKSCIHNGICKINVATAIQLGVTEDVQHYLATASNPNYIDMKAVMVEASRRVVADHIRLFESNNRA